MNGGTPAYSVRKAGLSALAIGGVAVLTSVQLLAGQPLGLVFAFANSAGFMIHIPYVTDQLVMTRLPPATFSLMLALLPAIATAVGLSFSARFPASVTWRALPWSSSASHYIATFPNAGKEPLLRLITGNLVSEAVELSGELSAGDLVAAGDVLLAVAPLTAGRRPNQENEDHGE